MPVRWVWKSETNILWIILIVYVYHLIVQDSRSTWTNGWRKLCTLAPFLWPKKSLGLQLRVVLCIIVVIAGRVINVYVPVYSQKIGKFPFGRKCRLTGFRFANIEYLPLFFQLTAWRAPLSAMTGSCFTYFLNFCKEAAPEPWGFSTISARIYGFAFSNTQRARLKWNCSVICTVYRCDGIWAVKPVRFCV